MTAYLQITLWQPRFGLSYLIQADGGTVVRASYTRAMETPYNENLLLSSTTGSGRVGVERVRGALIGRRSGLGTANQYSVGLQQNAGRFLQVDANYFWKTTKNAFDFDTLFNTSIAFPIEWRQSKIDGVAVAGFQLQAGADSRRTRHWGIHERDFSVRRMGAWIFNSPLDTEVFRIDHDQALQADDFPALSAWEGWHVGHVHVAL